MANHGHEIVAELLGGQDAVMETYDKISEKDEQSAELFKDVFDALAKRFDINQDEAEALRRLVDVVENRSKYQPALTRNVVFKAANAIGLKLPSGSF